MTAPAPAPDRLQVLLDRACRGVASAAEAEQLRAAVAELDDTITRVRAIVDSWRSIGGIQWAVHRLDEALSGPPAPKCARCHGLGRVPDWSRWNAHYDEPEPKPCPECASQT